jgi:hypothetical protein
MFAMKALSVLFCMVAGVALLVAGLGGNVPLIKFREAAAYGVPAGIGVMLVGVLLAAFWKVSSTTTERSDTAGSGGFWRKLLEKSTVTKGIGGPKL